jgi:hypothetical protein
MRIATLSILFFLGLGGCTRTDRALPLRVESPDYLPALVGRRVLLDGIVSNAPVPQLCGVDLWGLEKFAGKRLRATGVLQCTVVVRTGIDTFRAIDSGRNGFGQPMWRKAGTYYRLQELSYDLVKRP